MIILFHQIYFHVLYGKEFTNNNKKYINNNSQYII